MLWEVCNTEDPDHAPMESVNQRYVRSVPIVHARYRNDRGHRHARKLRSIDRTGATTGSITVPGATESRKGRIAEISIAISTTKASSTDSQTIPSKEQNERSHQYHCANLDTRSGATSHHDNRPSDGQRLNIATGYTQEFRIRSCYNPSIQHRGDSSGPFHINELCEFCRSDDHRETVESKRGAHGCRFRWDVTIKQHHATSIRPTHV